MEEVKRPHPMDALDLGGLAVLLSLGLLLGVGYLLTLWGQRFFFGAIHPFFSTMILALFMGVGLAFLKKISKTEWDKGEPSLQNRNYRKVLLECSKDLASLSDRQTLSERVIKTLTEILNVRSATFFLFDPGKMTYRLWVSVGWDKEFQNISLPLDDPLIRRLSAERRILTEEAVKSLLGGEEKTFLVREMRLLSAKIILPMVVKEKLIGFCSLGAKLEGKTFTEADLELLSILGNQASAALENNQLSERLEISLEILQRTDRLSSLGMMTAGLAHEIRNPLVAIRTFAQLLPERYQDREFIDGFHQIAIKEVDRVCGLIDNLLSFARPAPPAISAEDINEIIEDTIRLLESEARGKSVQIHRELAADIAKIYVDKEKIKQVCMNVILNAIQAIVSEGVIGVSTRLFHKNGSAPLVQIEVRDSGGGIPEEDFKKIFDPFFTTKKDGSGLGLAISHQIVQEHGGYIVVESKVGKGTTFLIHLPTRQLNHPGADPRPQVHEEYTGR